MKKFISVILAAVLLLGTLTGCTPDEEVVEAMAVAFLRALQNSGGNGVANENDSLVEVPGDLFVCTYSENDYKELLAAIDTYKTLAIEGGELHTVIAASDRLELLLEYCVCQQEIANVIYFAGMSETDKLKFEEMNDYKAAASSALSEAYREIYLSDSPMKQLLFEGYSEEQLAALEGSDSSKILEYNDTISEVQERFYALDSEDENWDSELNNLFVSFVKNGNALAKQQGYENYYEYVSAEGYMRDFVIDKTKFRSYVVEYLIPLLLSHVDELTEAASSYTFPQLMAYSTILLDPEYAKTSGMLEKFIDTFDGRVRENALRMFDGKHILWGGDNSYPTACTVDLSCFDEAVCYFGPEQYSSISTVAHEMGHFISMDHYNTDEVSCDFLETHSQSTEMLLLGFLEGELDPRVFELYEKDKIITFLTNIILCTIVDEFEERMYSCETPITVDDIDRTIDELCEKYGQDFCELLDVGIYIKSVVIQAPVYYISYATSGLCALGLYCKVKNEGYEAAYESYEKLQEGPIGVSFPESIEYAGLPNPFEESTFRLITETITEDEAQAKNAA